MEVGEILSLKASSYFKGEMNVNKLSIEPGAKFIGSCLMADKNGASHAPVAEPKK